MITIHFAKHIDTNESSRLLFVKEEHSHYEGGILLPDVGSYLNDIG